MDLDLDELREARGLSGRAAPERPERAIDRGIAHDALGDLDQLVRRARV
jgi:hypothetical protein